MGFYNNDSKITFDKAEELVDEFTREFKDRRSHVRARDVCQEMEVEQSMHNKIRVHEALEKQCETIRKSNGTKFKIK